ncbi:tolloid-like protein 2 [Physella acuta]|uniref:tolloid-like protein 2 n=1 Tax=Physella acuta TaxID=109671 RepID=UPI0027DC89F0|nr:tolloid-like protein 2 [Physella acuta]
MCDDIDECHGQTGSPCQQICNNNNGGYSCSCNAGYILSSTDHQRCIDIDECNDQAGNPCQQNCTNTVGSYSCSCSPGYTVSGTNSSTCDDIDECNGSSINPCQQNCTNTVGNYSCSCSAGYTVSGTNSSTCDDIDECSGTSNPCEDVCTNTIGSYTCSCQRPGYIIDKTNPTKCKANYIPCNTDASENTGIIISPNYPQKYPVSSKCFWKIPIKQHMVTIISILDFHLETSSDCGYDYLKIYNGTTIRDPLLYTFCGQFKPDPISSPNNLYLVFRYDGSVSYKGFKLIYTYGE